MNWKFVIKTGQLFDPTGKLVASGYAGGNCGKNPEGINNPLMCSVHNIGPLPPGLYTFGKLWEPHPKVGQYAFELIPDPKNVMFGRADFFCHGDTLKPRCASEGCIIMPRNIRELMYASTVRTIQVVAE
jgi:hypothetical protein